MLQSRINILASVGAAAVNQPQDVVKIQALLQNVIVSRHMPWTGPFPAGPVDGSDPDHDLTVQAIKKFQTKWVSWLPANGRIDRDGSALRKLNSFVGGKSHQDRFMITSVKPQKQKYDAGCWIEATSLMLIWKFTQVTSGAQALAMMPQKYQTRFREGKGLAFGELTTLFRFLFLSDLKSIPEPHQWLDRLRKYGPHLVIRYANPQADHMVVVIGAEVDRGDASGDNITYADPGYGRIKTENVDTFYQWISRQSGISKIWYFPQNSVD